jgi:hypothetical protein
LANSSRAAACCRCSSASATASAASAACKRVQTTSDQAADANTHPDVQPAHSQPDHTTFWLPRAPARTNKNRTKKLRSKYLSRRDYLCEPGACSSHVQLQLLTQPLQPRRRVLKLHSSRTSSSSSSQWQAP